MNPDVDAPEDGGAPAAFSGSRLGWRDLPRHVRARIASVAGGPVVAEVVATSGFSPGFAGVLELADGSQVFVKAVSPSQNPQSPWLARAEIRAAAAIPLSVPTPRLRWSHDDGEWVLLGFDVVGGRPPTLPWVPEDLDRVLAAVVDLAATRPRPGHALPAMPDEVARAFTGWRSAAALPERERAEIVERTGELGRWAAQHLGQLVAWEERAPEVAQGDRLVHGDLRGDNVMLEPEQLWFVDWPHAAVGAPWLDLVCMLPSVAMQGGGEPQRIFESSPLSQAVSRDALRAFLAGAAGFLTWSAMQPDPPGLPNLRAFQRAQAYRAVAWLREIS